MGRWEPNARERMMRAALELFAEYGFEQTTAGDIAASAGVTERTFFRHFAATREVLFDGAATLDRSACEAILAAPADHTALDAALAGVVAGGELLEGRREYATVRARIVASHPSLRERELLKLAKLAESVAEALRTRGVSEPEASLAAHSAVTVFHVAFVRWIGSVADPGAADGRPTFAECAADIAAAFRALK
jgi:AcrR family transcriptional regulator